MVKPFDPTGYVSLTSPSSCEENTWHTRQERVHDDDLTEPYPPSLNNFDKPKSYMEDVKDSVVSELIEKQAEKIGSPSWTWKAQKKLNHTGEQPLIVQEYLSSNKKEQEDGVLPAKRPQRQKFRSKSAGSNHRGELYQLSITAHQFLTATEMPNESEKIVDHRHGRPTRTSLLRARKRIPSAPGVKATVEVRTDLHLQQRLAAKREEKYKTVDVPEELLPITDTGETVHQFLVGARYNRGHYRDAKCLTTLGLYVCRDDISNCFLRPTSSQSSFHPRNPVHEQLMRDELSVSSSSLRSSVRPKSARPSSRSREAWTTSGQASAPHTSPTDSREGFNSNEDHPRPIAKKTVIDGSCLRNSRSSRVSDSVDEDACVLCQSNVPLCKGSIPAWSKSERRNSNPARLWSGKKFGVKNELTSTKESLLKDLEEKSKSVSTGGTSGKDSVQHMALQQYHLRILGTKVGVKSGIPSAPRSNILYQNVKKTQPTRKSTSARAKKNVNANNNVDKERDFLEEPKGEELERPSSQISVHISTKSLSEDDGYSLNDKDVGREDENKLDSESVDEDIFSELENNVDGGRDPEIGDLGDDDELEGKEDRAGIGQDCDGGGEKEGDKNSGVREDGCETEIDICQDSNEFMGQEEIKVPIEDSDIDTLGDVQKILSHADNHKEGGTKEGSDPSVLENVGQDETANLETMCEVESEFVSNAEDTTRQAEEDVSLADVCSDMDKTDIT